LSSRSAVVAAAALLGVAALAEAQQREGDSRTSFVDNECIALAALQPLDTPQPATVPAPEQNREANAEADLRRPMSAAEIELLIRAMQPIPLKEGRGSAIRAVVEPTDLAPERMRFLVADATALLAELHARETLGRLKQAPSLKQAARAQMERMLETMRSCARTRFAQRGGDAAFQESLQVVEKNRTALESLLLRREGSK
jgi:hypothetical protein